MTKLHELLAAERTPTSAWNTVREETIKKFKNPENFFRGHSKTLAMIEDTPANKAEEEKSREEKAIPTNVKDTLDYALDLFAKSEDLQYRKNATNRTATGTVLWRGKEFLKDLPVDELLGLEARLAKLREVIDTIPTLDATKHWVPSQAGTNLWELQLPEKTTKTEKVVVPVIMSPATDKHPAQVQAVGKDVVVGVFSLLRRSGEATAIEKSDMILRVDELLVEIKQARMRANETVAVDGKIGKTIVDLIMEPLKGVVKA